MRIVMYEFGHGILALFKHHRERPEKFRPEWRFNLAPCALSSSNKPLVGNTLLKNKKKEKKCY